VEIATLAAAQRYLQKCWQIEYCSLNGILVQLRKYVFLELGIVRTANPDVVASII
jgi:hypothetical protein